MITQEIYENIRKHNKMTPEIYEKIKLITPIINLGPIMLRKYSVSSVEEILYPIIKKNNVMVVAGAFFGDEGKGKITDAIANHPDIKLIMRPNSGENAGHTVYNEGIKYVFHLVPSGILVPDKTCLVGPECVMDPVNFMDELSQLIDNKKDYSNLYVGNTHIVTPYHKLSDLIQTAANSSTLMGISPIHSSKAKKRGLRLDDLFMSEDHQKKILETDMRDYQGLILVLGTSEEEIKDRCAQMNEKRRVIPKHVTDFLEANNKTDYLIDLFNEAVVSNSEFPQRTQNRDLVQETLDSEWKVLLEAAQSFYLANKTKTHFRSATSADTTAAGTVASANYNQFENKTGVINIIKFEASRVGRGENPIGYVTQTFYSDQGITTLKDLEGVCDDFETIQTQFMNSIGENGILEPTTYKDKDGKQYPINVAMAIASSKNYGERGATTFKPRVTGLVDCVAHSVVNKKQGPYTSITAMDRGDDCEKVGLAVAYTIYVPEGYKNPQSEGREYKTGDMINPRDDMPNEQVLKYAIPIIKTMKGWKDSPIAANKRKENDSIPKSVQDYISTFEQLTGAKVVSIGNGQDSKNLIYIKEDRRAV